MFLILSKYKNRLMLLAAILFAATLAAPSLTIAQEQGGSGLSISPTRTELSLEPGTADSIVVSLKNITSGAIEAKVFVNDFEPDNETGEPKLVVDPDKQNAASITSFLSGVEDVVLEAGESKDVSIDVAIPNDAAPGGYYGAIRFQAVPVNSSGEVPTGNEVSLTANLLSLVLIEVPGDIEQKVAVNFAKAFLDDNAGSIFTQKPNFVGVEVDNQGNSFVKPFGTISVTNYSGDEVFSYEVNDSNPRSNVLPSSTRVFKKRFVNIEKKTVNGEEQQSESSPISSPGRYTVTASVSYGNGGEVFTITSTFWYIPSWLIIALAVALFLLIAAAYYLYRKYTTRSTKRRR